MSIHNIHRIPRHKMKKPPCNHRVICSECGVELKVKPDFPLNVVCVIARANGWRSTKNSKAWVCPKHERKNGKR